MNALPNRRVEDWKYSDLRNAVDPAVVTDAPTAAWSVAAASGAVDIADLPAILPRGEHGAMAEFAIASAKAGPYLRVARGDAGAAHLQLTEGGHGRALIVVEDGASLTLEETVLARDFANVAVEIAIGANATLTHVRHAPARAEAAQVADYSVRIAAGGRYRAHIADFGARLSRTELHIALEGADAEAHISGASVLDGCHADVTTHVTHAVADTRSTQLFKYVAGGHSRGVYQGKVSVAHGADGSDSRQTAKGMLLGGRAEIDLKPELEILADDVKCAHGAAVGDLDADSLFYLQSRGIPEAEARALLMRAFLGDAVDEIRDETIRAAVWLAVEAALERLS
ncbi:MAG: SufB/SufD family protein [Rhizomicrobium sp.]